MNKSVDMRLFLTAVLSGATSTRSRHVKQGEIIQLAISKRWSKKSPWTWQKKHLFWFLQQSRTVHSPATHYRYVLTIQLIATRLGKPWKF